MEEFRSERKSAKHPVFGSNFEHWYLQQIRRNAFVSKEMSVYLVQGMRIDFGICS